MFIIQYIRAGCKRKTRAGQCGKQHGVKTRVREALSSYIYRRTKRSPMILPILMEV